MKVDCEEKPLSKEMASKVIDLFKPESIWAFAYSIRKALRQSVYFTFNIERPLQNFNNSKNPFLELIF